MRPKSPVRPVENAIAELATRQHGVVGRGQLLGLGVGSGGIARRQAAGRLRSLHPGVYSVGHGALTQKSRWMAAVLACGNGAVLSHRSAAALWSIRRSGSHAIEVTALPETYSRRSLRRHSSALPPDEMTTHDGIPVTTVPRTLLDLAAISPTDVVEFALRESEYLRHYDALSLQDLVDRYPGRRGVAKARTCLDRHRERPKGRVRSPLEERFVPFLHRHRLPMPQLNAWIDLGDKRFQVDCLWRPQRQIVELDGWEGHGTRTAFREDRARDRRLRVAGYAVNRLTWSQLDDEPTAIAADLRALLQHSV